MAAEKAFLIDGTAFCYRAFYAIRALATPDGRPTNAVYGFATMLQALQEKEQPHYLGVAFDVGKPTFRHKKFEAYKAHRKPMPDSLVAQLPLVKALLAAYRIPVFECEGYEAEDVLATIAKAMARQGVDVYLVTGDKDALQLVNSHIKVYNPHHEGLVLDAAAVRSRYGIEPDRMTDLMALMGDDIDNIPGVPGIGEKTAVALLQRFGSLEGVYGHLDDIESASRRANLAAFRDQAQLARELARIDAEVPVTVRLAELAIQEPDWRALRSLFRELEFKRLLTALERRAPRAAGPATSVKPLAAAADVADCLQALGSASVSAMGCWPARRSAAGPAGESIVFAAAVDPESAWVGRLDRELIRQPTWRRLVEWLGDPSRRKVGHDVKGSVRLLNAQGLRVAGLSGDTMIAAYLLNPARTSPTLSDLAEECLSERLSPVPSDESLLPLGEVDRANPYAQAVCAVLRLDALLTQDLEAKGLARLYQELELPLLAVLADMEATGIAVDLERLSALRASMEARLAQLTEEIYRLAGSTFNLNSPKQLAHVLFEQLHLPIVKRTKTGASTDSEVLQQLASQHPLPARLTEYRELSKLVSTYLEALPKMVDPRTGRIHTTFHQTGTATGRLSSSEPNLQNIPVKTELGRSIRTAFVPGAPDWVLLAADYSQIELRILAHVSEDEALLQAFRENRDIHRFTASLLYGIPEAQVQPEQRHAMKAVNYGILYGMTSHGLSKELGMSFEEAQAFIDAYFQRYPKVRAYLDRQIQQGRRDGFVQTLLGRRRYIPELNSPDALIRQLGERMAINAPIQGSAADLIKQAMVDLAGRLAQRGVIGHLLLQVHDELIWETPRQSLQALAGVVRETMEQAIQLTVPLTVTLKAGPNWLEMTEL